MIRLFSFFVLVIALIGFVQGTQAVPITYLANLDGASEDPPVPSSGSGTAVVEIDLVAHILRVQVIFSDLTGTTTVAHIHAPTSTPGVGNIGVAVYPGTFPGFPAGVTSGTYDSPLLDLTAPSTFSASFLTLGGGTAAGAEALLAASLAAGTAYLNIHTSFRPAGEIRGFLQPVPEAATLLLLGSGLLGLVGLKRRFRK